MNRSMWLIGVLILAAVIAVVRPSGSARRRLRTRSSGERFTAPTLDLREIRARLESLALRRPRRLMASAAVLAALLGLALGGPVAALVGVVYGMLAARALVRLIAKQRDTAARGRRLDGLCALAADLRAGLPPTSVPDLPPVSVAGRSAARVSKRAIHAERRIAELTSAVWRLAEHTGAPAAELVDRIEADARAADRAKASAAAQAAGAQATAVLLAALPLGGIALGYGIGADPLRVLLHTPLGAACAAGAVLLQCAGLFWADRLTNGPVR